MGGKGAVVTIPVNAGLPQETQREKKQGVKENWMLPGAIAPSGVSKTERTAGKNCPANRERETQPRENALAGDKL